ncbi:MAG TPA: helix-turn-helix domain-containing protein [Nitriliruptorales bacterium]
MTPGRLIREARREDGLTQAELARRVGTSQAAISAYESGARSPSVSTLERLLAACGKRARITLEPRPAAPGSGPIAQRVRERRSQLRRALATSGARNPRVFGSVARGTDTPGSDLDLLVDLPRPSYVLLEQVRQAAEDALGLPVDVSTPELLRDEIRERVLADAVPL